MDWFELLLLAAAALPIIYLLLRRPKNFPPGPASLPVVGSLPAIAMVKAPTPHDAVCKLAQLHGPVMGMFLGRKPVVVVSGYQAVKHVLGREDLALKPDMLPIAAYLFNKQMGVFDTKGPVWKNESTFSLRLLRDFGFGRQTVNTLLHREARALLEAVEKEVRAEKRQDLDLLPIFPVLAVNILSTLIVEEKHKVDEKIAAKDELKPQRDAALAIQQFIGDTVEKRMEQAEESTLRDFVDIYIEEIKMQQQKPDACFTNSQLSVMCMDLFNAGTEKTASTLGYCLRYVMQRPHMQDKLRSEVLRVVGRDRLPTTSDMPKLHYSQAVMHEIIRHSGMIPLTPPHATSKDTEILGYRVPKGTYVMVNLWSVHMDSKVWQEPETFRPERFLTQDGTFRKDEHLMTFGHGPLCMGESMARYSTFVFLFFSALVQNFKFHAVGPPPFGRPVPGFTPMPSPFRLAISRVK